MNCDNTNEYKDKISASNIFNFNSIQKSAKTLGGPANEFDQNPTSFNETFDQYLKDMFTFYNKHKPTLNLLVHNYHLLPSRLLEATEKDWIEFKIAEKELITNNFQKLDVENFVIESIDFLYVIKNQIILWTKQ